jgi:hypothetical protein
MAWKDYISLAISIFALIISAIGSYYTNFRESNIVQMLITTASPEILSKGDPDVIHSGVEGSILFANAGNRTSVIIDLEHELVFLDKSEAKRYDCDYPSKTRVHTRTIGNKFEPFTMKPGDAVLRKFAAEDKVHIDDVIKDKASRSASAYIMARENKIQISSAEFRSKNAIHMCIIVAVFTPGQEAFYKKVFTGVAIYDASSNKWNLEMLGLRDFITLTSGTVTSRLSDWY